MPKKPPQNAFYFFMKDLQEEYREGGKTPSLKELAEIAHPLFQKLDQQTKLKYESKAKQAKSRRSETNEGRFSSDGIPLQQLKAEEEELEFQIKEMKTAVINFVNDNIYCIADTPIYIITFNCLVATSDLIYLPNEVGIVKYTMNEGIVDSFHKFINPGAIPSGYAADAKEHCENTHQIPFLMDDFEYASTDYSTILKNILKFINAQQGKKVVFSSEDHMEQSTCCFQWLVTLSDDIHFVDNVSFADLGLLVTELLKVAGYIIPSKTSVDDILTINTFDYEPKTRCDYHEDLDSPYCAIAFSRKMCFLISDNVIKHYGIPLTYRHLPEKIIEIVPEQKKSDINIMPLDSNLSSGQASKLCVYTYSSEDEEEDMSHQSSKSIETKTSGGLTFPQENEGFFGRGRGSVHGATSFN